MDTFMIAQIFGILGMTMNISSYQAKKQKTIIFIQFWGSLFFSINMFMLNAIMGGILNIIGVLRAVLYMNKNKFKKIKTLNLFFICLYILSYISVFLIFKKEFTVFNAIIEILPLIAMISSTIGFAGPDASKLRHLTLISSPAWLLYNCINRTIGGILCECFSIVSVFIGIFRHEKSTKERSSSQ